MKRVAIYLRVSTDCQTVSNQLLALNEVGDRLGWQIVTVLRDDGISGAKGRDRRPGFDALLKGVARRDFDLIATWSVDRLGRSLQDLVGLLGELRARNVDLYLHQQGVDTSTPAGRAMFQLLGVFAEFERSMIVDRVRAGINRARSQGKRLGRPPTPPATISAIRISLANGIGIHRTARTIGVGTGTVQRVSSELKALSRKAPTDNELHSPRAITDIV